MRGTSASRRRLTSVSSYLAALLLATPAALTLFSASAHAQSKPEDRRAYELFREGDELYKQGRFSEAAEKFRAAYELDPNPTLLYNLARSYENQGELEQAAATYRKFLDQQPDAADRGAIERRIETLQAQIDEKQALERAAKERERKERETPAPSPPPPERDRASGPGIAPWIVIGVGGAALVTGGVLRLIAEQKHSDAEDDPDALSALDKQDSAESLADASTVLAIAGAAVTAGGIGWLLIGGSGSDQAELGVRAGPGTIAIRGRF